MEETLRTIAEILGGIAFLWTSFQERRHRKDKKAPTLHEAANSGSMAIKPRAKAKK